MQSLQQYWSYVGDLYFGLGPSLGGLLINISFAFAAIPICLLLGVLVAVFRTVRLSPVRYVMYVYVELAKSTPLILMIFWFYSLLPSLLNIEIGLWQGGFIAIVFLKTAYMSEVVRSGLNSIEMSEVEIARVSGMSNFYILTHIVIPQVIIRMLPAKIGVCISLFKDTSALYIIGIVELTQTGQIISNREPDSLLFIYFFTGLGYYVVCSILSLIEKNVSSRDFYRAVNKN